VATAERVESAVAARAVPRRRVKSWPVLVFSVLGIVFFVVFMLFPFYWMLVVSLKTNTDLYRVTQNPFTIPQATLSHYSYLFTKTEFPRWVVNSIVVSVVSCGGSLVFSVFAGYSLARLRYRGAGVLGWAMFITYLVPPTVLFLPLTAAMAQFHLLNNLWALMLSYPTFLIPFCTWLLMGYFKGIPRELEESAVVDGCTRLQAMLRIAIPLAIPGILSAAIFAFTLSWNEYLYALSLVSNSALKTVPYGVPSELIRDDAFFWGELMAAALLGSVPVAVLYSFFVNHFVEGITAGAVKG
jgi:multiple sugar transport system permease protein